jgi:YVTN family beta-propeller protein
MTEVNLVELAQAGDAEAIATLMNASLQTIGIRARAILREDNLHVLLESEQTLAPRSCIEFIRQGIARLGVACLSSAVVYSRVVGQTVPNWVQRIDLSSLPLITNPFALAPEEKLEIEPPFWLQPNLLIWNRGRLFDLLLLLSVPLLVVLSSLHIWTRYLTGETVAPHSAGISTEIAPTGKDASASDPFAAVYERATTAVRLTQAAKMQASETWYQVRQEWQQATALMKTVPHDHPRHDLAQQKAQEYQRYAEYAASLVGMHLKKVITGGIAPKSIALVGNQFFVPNAEYPHTITVYDREYNLVRTISDRVNLAEFGYTQIPGSQQGAPIEAAASPDRESVWVSNYQMSGDGFQGAAEETCSPTTANESSFLYRIGTEKLTIDRVVQVGAMPKSVAVSPDSRFVLVSNWCSWDVSVVDTQQQREVRRIQIGPYPRGIAIDATSERAYVAILGGDDIGVISLKDFSVSWITSIGRAPHHLILEPTGKYLYASFSGEGQVAKIELATQRVIGRVTTGSAPRSMAMSTDGKFLYVVNYNSDTLSKVRTEAMQIVQTVNVNPAPIGVTYDPQTQRVWVAAQSGSILVFQD